ncbi:MAG TPA: hypothetical protein VIP77_06045 [Jiangellaceae bacterium]
MTYHNNSSGAGQGSQSHPASAEARGEVMKHEADRLGGAAAEAGSRVAEVTRQEASSVAGEAGQQAREFADRARHELVDQAGHQKGRAAKGLRSLSEELESMAQNSAQSGPASQYTRQAATRVRDFAQWLDDHEPGDLLDEVKAFARKRPGAFLAITAGAGVLAGRLTRGLGAAASDSSGAQSQRSGGEHRSGSGTDSPSTARGAGSAGADADTPARVPGPVTEGSLPRTESP